MKNNIITEINTSTLVNELATREGVEEIIVNPYEKFQIGEKTIEGIARILIVVD